MEKWNRLLDPAKPEQLIFEDVEGEEGISLDDEEEELEGEEEELGVWWKKLSDRMWKSRLGWTEFSYLMRKNLG